MFLGTSHLQTSCHWSLLPWTEVVVCPPQPSGARRAESVLILRADRPVLWTRHEGPSVASCPVPTRHEASKPQPGHPHLGSRGKFPDLEATLLVLTE